METKTKFVLFDIYCPKCKYSKLNDQLYPCNECLENGINFDSHKPWLFEEDKKGSV